MCKSWSVISGICTWWGTIMVHRQLFHWHVRSTANEWIELSSTGVLHLKFRTDVEVELELIWVLITNHIIVGEFQIGGGKHILIFKLKYEILLTLSLSQKSTKCSKFVVPQRKVQVLQYSTRKLLHDKHIRRSIALDTTITMAHTTMLNTSFNTTLTNTLDTVHNTTLFTMSPDTITTLYQITVY